MAPTAYFRSIVGIKTCRPGEIEIMKWRPVKLGGERLEKDILFRKRVMRNMKSYITPNCIRTSRPVIAVVVTAIQLMVWLLLPWSVSAESGNTNSPKPAQTDHGRIAGKWLRPDGGYVLELSDVKSEGKLKAAYFNPRPINVGKAEWRSMDDRIQVFVELQDVNYPGSTYTLIYDPEHDRLNGYYYQAVVKGTFDVVFVRKE